MPPATEVSQVTEASRVKGISWAAVGSFIGLGIMVLVIAAIVVFLLPELVILELVVVFGITGVLTLALLADTIAFIRQDIHYHGMTKHQIEEEQKRYPAHTSWTIGIFKGIGNGIGALMNAARGCI